MVHDLRLLNSVAYNFDLHLKRHDTQLSLIVRLVHLIDLSSNCAFTHFKSAPLIHRATDIDAEHDGDLV